MENKAESRASFLVQLTFALIAFAFIVCVFVNQFMNGLEVYRSLQREIEEIRIDVGFFVSRLFLAGLGGFVFLAVFGIGNLALDWAILRPKIRWMLAVPAFIAGLVMSIAVSLGLVLVNYEFELSFAIYTGAAMHVYWFVTLLLMRSEYKLRIVSKRDRQNDDQIVE